MFKRQIGRVNHGARIDEERGMKGFDRSRRCNRNAIKAFLI
jgi:hypothetical protein